MVNGAEKDAIYDADAKTLKFKLNYSDWCLLDNIYIRGGKKYNGYNSGVKSEQVSLEIEHEKQEYDWDNSWTKEHYVAHALGSLDNIDGTNCLEAFEKNYELGQRVFEADILCTADGQLMLRHDWTSGSYGNAKENYESYEINNLARDWNDISESTEYTLLKFDNLLSLMEKYPDIYIVTDIKDNNSAAIENTFNEIVELSKNHEEGILNRLVVQVYNEPMFYQVMNIYPFKSIIYTLYQTDAKDADIIDFVKETGISAVTCNESRLSDGLTAELYRIGCPVYLHTIDDIKKVRKYAARGVYGFYSNDLGTFNSDVGIDDLRENYFASATTYLEDDENNAERKENYEALICYLKQLNNDNYNSSICREWRCFEVHDR